MKKINSLSLQILACDIAIMLIGYSLGAYLFYSFI